MVAASGQIIRTIFLHVDDDKGRGIWGEGRVMWPVIWGGRQLTLPDLVVRCLPGLIEDGPVVMCRVEDGQRPDAGRASCDQHKGAVHEPGRAPALPRLFCQAISRAIVATAIAAEPHFGCPTGFLLRWGARRLDDDIVPVCFAMLLDRCQQRRPRRQETVRGEGI